MEIDTKTDYRFEITRANIKLCEAEMALYDLDKENYSFKIIHPDSEWYSRSEGLFDTYNQYIAIPQHLMIDANPEELLNNLRHQIAHVLVHLDNTRHEELWKKTHKRIGGDGNEIFKDYTDSNYKKRFRYVCENKCYPAVELSTYKEEYDNQFCDSCGEPIQMSLINLTVPQLKE